MKKKCFGFSAISSPDGPLKEILPPYMADFGIFKKKSNLFIFYCILPALSESGLEISLRHSETSLIGGSNPQSRGGLTPIFLENMIFCKNGHQILIFYPILTNNSSFFFVWAFSWRNYYQNLRMWQESSNKIEFSNKKR